MDIIQIVKTKWRALWKQDAKHPPAEKPISLAGPKFEDVLKALLETKPMPKDKEGKRKNTP